jgi:hypothetical protein
MFYVESRRGGFGFISATAVSLGAGAQCGLRCVGIGCVRTWTTAIHVFGKQRHTGERLAARTAGVLLDIRVCLQVCPQVRPIGKRPVTVRAGERLLARVGTDVPL